MAPLSETSSNARVTRSSTRAQKGPPAPQRQPASAPGRSPKPSVPRKRKAPVEPESDSDFNEDVDAEEVEGEESDYEPEELPADELELLNELGTFDEDFEEDELETEFVAEDFAEDEEDEPTSLLFSNLEGPSGHKTSQDNINRYQGLFKATIEALKDASVALVKKHGGVQSLRAVTIGELPIHPGWIMIFMNGEPEVLTHRAIEDVPFRTRSILGDPDLTSDNWVAKLRELPKVPKRSQDFYAGEYINIADRLWHRASPDGRYAAGEIETRPYKGGTSCQDKGARIRAHQRFLRKTLPEARATFTKRGIHLPYHYQFGCQAPPSEDGQGPAYQCRSDFRSMGHISDSTDASKAVWPWLRELVNQILLYMLPSYGSSFRCGTLTDNTKQMVHDIRQKLEAEFGQLPDLSHVTLNRGCCLMEPPRGMRPMRTTCVKCPRRFTSGAYSYVKGRPWEDRFQLYEPGNPMGAVICDGCSVAYPPPGHKFCRRCRHQVPQALFKGHKTCGRCRRRMRELERARADSNSKAPRLHVADDDLENDYKLGGWTDEDHKVAQAGIAAGLYTMDIAAKLPHKPERDVRLKLETAYKYKKLKQEHRPWTDDDKKTIIKMKGQDASSKEIGEALNRTSAEINNYVFKERKAGRLDIKVSKPGPKKKQ